MERCFGPGMLNTLLDELTCQGYDIIGPSVVDQAIRYRTIRTADELPIGWQDVQSPGHYSLVDRGDEAFFGFNLGPDSPRAFFLDKNIMLWEAERDTASESTSFQIKTKEKNKQNRLAFIGLRACEIKAISIQDRVYLSDPIKQTCYESKRQDALFIAVNCTTSTSSCFCTSQGGGPKVTEGADLVLTEVCDQEGHYFVVSAPGEQGKLLLQKIDKAMSEGVEENSAESGAGPNQFDHRHVQKAESLVANNARKMSKTDLGHAKDLLADNLESSVWDRVAETCLSCANCTLVCPTCFCTTVEDTTDLSGEHAQRWLKWDSCFNENHSYLHGGSVRHSISARYRQWLTHKLSTWHDQFGESGCVGCGRCITWCPVGIDLRDVINSMQDEHRPPKNRIPVINQDDS